MVGLPTSLNKRSYIPNLSPLGQISMDAKLTGSANLKLKKIYSGVKASEKLVLSLKREGAGCTVAGSYIEPEESPGSRGQGAR